MMMQYAEGPKWAVALQNECKRAKMIRPVDEVKKLYCKMMTGNYYEYDSCMGGRYDDIEDYVRAKILVGLYLPDWSLRSS